MHVFCELCGREDTSTIKQNPDYCSHERNLVHLVCLPIVLTGYLDASCQGNYLTVREVIAHIGKIYCI